MCSVTTVNPATVSGKRAAVTYIPQQSVSKMDASIRVKAHLVRSAIHGYGDLRVLRLRVRLKENQCHLEQKMKK